MDVSTMHADVTTRKIDAPSFALTVPDMIKSIESNHKIEYNAAVEFVLTTNDPVTVKCSLCKSSIMAGSHKSRLHNLRAHIVSRAHRAAIHTACNLDPYLKTWLEIDASFKRQFVRENDFVVCRDDGKKIKLNPVAGDVIGRLSEHLASKTHKIKRGTVSSNARIDTYFKKTE